jgi:hypothetical protein
MGSSDTGLARPQGGEAASRGAIASRLQARFSAWCQEPYGRHALAIAVLMLLAATRWWRQVFDPFPQNDETLYFAAFEAVRRGDSPFTVSGYLTFSSLAHFGAWSMDLLGRLPTLAIVRTANLVGLTACVWCASAWLPWRWERRLLASMLYVAVAPPVAFGVKLGNLSPMMAGMMIIALLFWPRLPVAAGALLGLSLTIKPVAPAAIVALLFHRPGAVGRRHLVAGSVAAIVAAAVVLGSPHLGTLLSKEIWFRLGTTVSPYRFAHLLGLEGSEPFVLGLVLLATILVARSRVLGRTQCYALAATAAIAATPVVWSHTLLVTLPLQVLALLVLAERHREFRRSGATRARHSVWGEIALVVLAVVALQTAEGATNTYDQHFLIQWFGTLPPALGPAVLTGYLLRHTEPF